MAKILTIPREIRDEILRFVIETPTEYPQGRDWNGRQAARPNNLSLLLTCQQIRDESIQLLSRIKVNYVIDCVRTTESSALLFTWRLLPALSPIIDTLTLRGYYKGESSLDWASEALSFLFAMRPRNLCLKAHESIRIKLLEYHVFTTSLLTRREHTSLVADLQQRLKDAFERQDQDGSVGEVAPHYPRFPRHAYIPELSHGWSLSTVRCVVNGENVFEWDSDTMRNQGF